MEGRQVYWGDFHTHFTRFDIGDDIMRAARENTDFYAVLCYPFTWSWETGFHIESVRQQPQFLDWWREHHRYAAEYNNPGKFTTFLGYEWHGNRTRWGDHNVIYRDAEGELLDAWELDDLYAKLRGKPAFAIPHHTAYTPAHRGKDWSCYDPVLSPVMEVYSVHGSSEGPDTPRDMTSNASMGPRSSGSSWQDALARGIRIGCIGSNDYQGLPGRWNLGRAAVWAPENSREALFDAIAERRTYAVTGDRIILDFSVAGIPMGGEGKASGAVEAMVSVEGSHAIDRIEILHNNVVVATYCHQGSWERNMSAGKRWKFRVVAGWGPCSRYGFKMHPTWPWDCALALEGGTIADVEKCITLPGQDIREMKPERCAWQFETGSRDPEASLGNWQGLVFTIDGDDRTRMHLEAEGKSVDLSLGELAANPVLVSWVEECIERARREKGVEPEDVENPDIYYHNARKIKLHRAVPEAAWRVTRTFGDLKLEPGANWFYARVTQTNGQLAWSSPVWIDA
jgi:hypothetical protein